MRIGFFCESPADQAALAVFAEGILGERPEPINMDLEARSVPGLFGALDGVIRGAHFHSNADALVIVVDSDESDLHRLSHDLPNAEIGNCRYCRISKIVNRVRPHLKAVPGKQPLKIAIGLAIPAIEAWYLVGNSHQVGEASWLAALESRIAPPFTKAQLKTMVYRTDRPSLELATKRGVEEARRISANLSAIETAFPMGFGQMAAAIRSWR